MRAMEQIVGEFFLTNRIAECRGAVDRDDAASPES